MREDVSRASCGSKQQVDTGAAVVASASYFLLHLCREHPGTIIFDKWDAGENCAIGKFSPSKPTYNII